MSFLAQQLYHHPERWLRNHLHLHRPVLDMAEFLTDLVLPFENHKLQARGIATVSVIGRRPDSPLDFLAAIQSEETAKSTSFSDGEDEGVLVRKMSSAQYELFRQAVTSSKGSFKIVPARS